MFSAIALVLTLFTLLPEGALKAHALDGDGTKDNPYIIMNYDDLQNLLSSSRNDLINLWDGKGRCSNGVYFKLGTDIISQDKQNDYEIDIYTSTPVYIDLAGHTLSRKSDRTMDYELFFILQKSTLTIDDSVGGGKIESDLPINVHSSYLFENNGTLIIKNGTFNNHKCIPQNTARTIAGEGTTIIYDGTFYGHSALSNESIIYNGKFVDGETELYNTKVYGGKFYRIHANNDTCEIYNAEVTQSTNYRLIQGLYTAHSTLYLDSFIYSGATVKLDGNTVSRNDLKEKYYLTGKKLVISTPIATHATIYTPDLVHGGKAEAAQVSGGLGFIMSENCITGWRDLTEGKDMQLGDTFTGGHKYRLGVTIGTQDGYVIGKTPDIFTSIDNAKITSVEKLNDFFCNVLLEIDCPKTTVSTVNVTLTEPVAGAAIDETMISDTTGASVYKSATIGTTNKGTWYHGETAMSAGDKFAVGETYTAHFLIKADQGYEFADSLSVKVNGDTATYVKTEGIYRTYEISYTVASSITTVSTVRINVTKPKAGEIPEDATVFALTGKVPATVRTAWYHGDTQMASGEKFIAGETYTVKLLITHKASYEFSSPLKVFINNERVTSSNNSYSAVAEKSFTVESGQRLVGVANGDGLISADDAIIVARMAAGYGDYASNYDSDVADINQDGKVTADDAIIIARYSANYGDYRSKYTKYI